MVIQNDTVFFPIIPMMTEGTLFCSGNVTVNLNQTMDQK